MHTATSLYIISSILGNADMVMSEEKYTMSKIIAQSNNWKISKHESINETLYELTYLAEIDGYGKNPTIVMNKDQLDELLSFNNVRNE